MVPEWVPPGELGVGRNGLVWLVGLTPFEVVQEPWVELEAGQWWRGSGVLVWLLVPRLGLPGEVLV